MSIRIQLFDGAILEFPDNTPQDVIDRVAKQETLARQPAPQPRPVIEPPKKEGVMAAFGKGLESLLGSSRTAVGAFTGSPEEAALAALEREKQSPYADQVSMEKVSEAYKRGLLPAAGEVARQVPLAIAEQAPNILATLGSARLGVMAGAGLGSIVPGVGTVVGGIGGGILGAIAPSLLQQFGGNIERQAREQQERGQPISIDRTAAGAAALPQAGLDVVASLVPLGRTFAGKVLGPQVEQLLKRGSVEGAERLARESLPTVLGKGAAISIATEVPTEVIQSMLERAQAGLALTSDDALAEYGSVAYQAGLLAPIGAVGRVGERAAARSETLLPGQRRGESDMDFANRLSQEIGNDRAYVAMQQAEQAEAARRQAALEQMKQAIGDGLLTPEVVKQWGFGKGSIFDSLVNKNLSNPEDASFVADVLSAYRPKAHPNTQVKIDDALAGIEAMFGAKPTPQTEGAADVGTAITEPSGAGVQVAGKPDTGAATPRLGAPEPAGVVPPVEDAGQPAGGAEAAPAAVAPTLALPAPVKAPPVVEPVKPVQTPETETQAKEQHAVQGLPIVEAPLDQLTLSKDVPQFKSDADEKGVVEKLGGKFDRTGVAPIQVWRRTDGRMEVISGRHRLDLAQRSGEATIPAQIHDEAQGFDAKRAAMLDAELNIRDQQGKVKDYVNYFENAGISQEDADSRGLLARPPGRQGFAIATQGSPDLIASHRANVVNDAEAFGIASAAPGDARLQALGIKAISDGKNVNGAVNMMKAVKALAAERGVTEDAGDLFGFDDSAMREAEEMAKIASRKQSEVANRLSAISGASKRPEVAKKEGIDIKDPEALKRREKELRQQKASWDNWSSSSELIQEIKAEMVKPSLAEAAPEVLPITPEIQAKIDQLEKVLKKIMNKFGLKDVALKLIDNMKAEGEYSQSVVRLALDAVNPIQALRHESIHALKELGFFTPQQWAALEKQAKSKWIDQYLKTKNINKEDLEEGQKSRYDAYMELYKGDMDAIIEEAIADAFGDFDVNKAPPGLMQAILTRLRNFFDAIKTAFGGEVTAEQVFRKVEKGALKAEAKAEAAPAKQSLRIMRGEEKPGLTGKVTVDRVGAYFDAQIQKEFGRKLDYTNPQDFERAVQLATEEVQYQIKQKNSGLDWYEDDIKRAFSNTIKVLPELKKEDNRVLFSFIAGIMSPQTNARDNWFIAANAYEHYVNTGTIPGVNPENGNLWQGGTQSANKKVQLEFLNNMVQDMGQKAALKWLMTPHTVKEINSFRSKYGKLSSGIDGKMDDIRPGYLAFGPKVGPFVSNINGIHNVTVDRWMTRTFNRYFGTMIDPDGKIIDAPTEPQRQAIIKLADRVAQDAGIKNYQVQSLLWFYEQKLFTELGANSPSYGFSDGGKKFLESRRKGVTDGDGSAAKPDGGRKLSLRDKLGMYSELETKIEAGSNKAPAASWKAYINGLTQKGVKPEEIEWSGVRDWLDLQKGTVTKEDLLNYLKQGGVKVDEVVLGTAGLNVEGDLDVEQNINGDWGVLDMGNDTFVGGTYPSEDAAWEALNRMRENKPSKYGQYTLPGGDNYREVLLTLPTQFEREAKALKNEISALGITQDIGDVSLRDLIDAGASKDLQNRFNQAMSSIPKEYRSSHWDQPNVLAHIRMNDRTDADGNKVLFVEEIQSDWGQEGKKKGFAQADAAIAYKDYIADLKRRVSENMMKDYAEEGVPPEKAAKLTNAMLGRMEDWNLAEYMDEKSKLNELYRAKRKAEEGIPSAPFVTKTEGWLNLALKRVMVMAAEGGYDKVAFVNGEQSADRYDLSKQIDALEVQRPEYLADDKYSVTMIGPNGGILTTKVLSSNELEDNVGKDLAKKIIEDVKPGAFKAYRGLDLKVGGEGMKTFYDTIVPTALKKLLPKVGGGQMMDVDLLKDSMKKYDRFLMKDDLRILGEEGFRAKYAHNEQPGFEVTDAMREKVQTTGLPRFSLRVNIPPSARARVVATTVTRQEKGFVERLMEAISPSTYSDFRAQALNRYNQLGVYDKIRAKKMGGAALLADSSAESAALLSDLGAGLTASALGVHDRMGGIPVFRNGITVISNQNGTIKGPTAIFAPLAGDPSHYQAYQYWAGVKRGSRFLADGREELFNDPNDKREAEKIRKAFLKEGIDFEAIQKEWIKYNNGLVQYMVDTGVLSKERADIYRKHGDYLPFYRQMTGEKTVGPKVFQAISGVKPPKKLKGGEAPLDDFLEAIVRNTQSAIQAGVKNVAAQRAAKVAMDIGMARPLGYKSSDPLTFEVLENGKAVTYISQDILFVNAIKSLGIPDLPFIGLLSGPANLLRNLVTKDPGFMLANLMRDSMSAWVTSGVKMTPVVNTITNFGAAIAGKDPAFQALMNAGILGGYEFSQNVEQSGREFGKALRKQAGIKSTGIKGVVEMGTKPFTSLWDALEKGTTASDAATRMEVYKRTLAETGNEAEALFKALEVMNFNRKGSSAVVRILTAAVPFLNARMQGLDVLYRAASGQMNAADAAEIQKRFFVRGATIAALSAAYWLLTHDDEEYKKQEQETRDNYWLLPSLGIKIPIPFEIGVLFKVIPERILGYTFGSDTGEDFLKSMARQLTSTLAFNPIPQAVMPIVETTTNFSFFTMRPIVGQGMEGLQPAYQVGPGTTRLAEGLGEMTKGMAKELQVSPMKIDQLISGYTGTMGMYLMNLMDAVYDMTTDSPKPARRFEQMPLIRRFAVDPEARGNVTAYYELKNSIDSIVRTSNMLERTMNYEELPGYLMDNMKMLASKDYILDLEKTMKEFREMKILIRASKMDADTKKDAILSIDQMENQLTSNIQYMKKLAKGG